MSQNPVDEVAAAAARAELLDLGCGIGGSMGSVMRRFGVQHVIGVDKDRAKIEKAREQGLTVYWGDILEVDPDDFPSVEYVTIDNVLEHLPSLDAVEAVLASASNIASRLVYVRHPSFEDEEYLAALGLKQYWTDWPKGHTAHVLLADFMSMAARLGLYRVAISPVLRAFDSDDPTILPADAPPNQRVAVPGSQAAYDPELHGTKPSVVFDRPVYYAFDIVFAVANELPILTYPADPETSAARPTISWRSAEAAANSAAKRRANMAAGWIRELGESNGATDPVLARRSDGVVFVIEGGRLRHVRSAAIAYALEEVLGPPAGVSDEDLLPLTEGAPVEVFEGPDGTPFLLVGGLRLPLRGLPLPHPVDAEAASAFRKGTEVEAVPRRP